MTRDDFKDAPTYLMVVDEFSDDDVTGIDRNTWTSNPAMELVSIALHNHITSTESNSVTEKMPVQLSFNRKEQIIYAVVLRANFIIPRIDPKTQELYNIVWTPDQVVKARNKFHRNPQNLIRTGFEHLANIEDGAVFVVASWIVKNPKNDLSNEIGMKGVSEGDWILGYKFKSLELYEAFAKSGMALSLEGYFNAIRLDKKSLENIKQNKKIKMNKDTNMFAQLADFLSKRKKVTLVDVAIEDGTVLTVDETTGACTINGETAPDGDYKCADGTTITVKDGFVTNISSPNSQDQNQGQPQNQSQTQTQTSSDLDDKSKVVTIEISDELKKQLEELTAKVNDLVAKNATLTTDLENKQKEIETMKADNEKVVTELNEKLTKKPAAEAIDTTPLPTSKKFEEMSTAEQVWYKINQR